MKCILLPIKPQFVEEIRNGNKLYEYRKVIHKDSSINKLLIYASYPIKKIVAVCSIEIILCKCFIDKLLQELKLTIALEGWSCERIAIQLANDLLAKYDSKEVKVEVLEDGENGGGCHASKE